MNLDRKLLASLEPLTVERLVIPEGYYGTEATVNRMYAFLKKDAGHPYLVKLARQIIQEAGVAERDYEAEARALFTWIKANIKFVRNPYGMEQVQSAFKTLEYGVGDCGEQSVLAAVLLNALGHPVRFVTIKHGGPEFVHVYTEVMLPDSNWTAFDTAVHGSYLGWRANGSAQKIWGMEGFGGFDGLSGLGDIWGDIIGAVVPVVTKIYTMKAEEKAQKEAEERAAEQAAAMAAAEAENTRRLLEAAEQMRVAKLAEQEAARAKAIAFVPETLTAVGDAMGSAKPLFFLGGGALITALVYRIITRKHKRKR